LSQAEDLLDQSEERYRALFELAPGAIFVMQEGRFVFANPHALTLVGAASVEQLAEHPYTDYLGAEGGEKAQNRYGLIAGGHKLEPTHYSMRTLDGRVVEVEVKSAPITFNGKPAFLSAARDITEEKQAKRHLERQMHEIRALHGLAEAINRSGSLAQIFPEAVQAVRRTSGANRAAVLLFDDRRKSPRDEQYLMRYVAWDGLSGQYRAATEGHSPWTANEENAQPILVPHPEQDPSIAHLLPVLRVERIASLAFIPIAHQGRLFGNFMLCFNDPHEFSAEETRLALTMAEQLALAISRQRAGDEVQRLNAELEERVRQRTAQLEIANREMESFCYSVSHDLRAPLRALDGFARILLEDAATVLDENDKDNLRRIISASERMGWLMDDLLRLSRIGRAGMRLGRVGLSAIAGEVMERLRVAAPGRRLDLRVAPDLSAEADMALMRIALENLLGNAWKYTRNTPQARIEFGAKELNGRLCYFVRDNGTGFDMQYATKLFSPFQRVHSPTEFEGNGIGLAIMQRIVQRHGGRAWAESEPGNGATFWFTLWDDGIPSELQPISQPASVPPSLTPASFPPA
jgi:PAS domain S-box-containing protein